MTKICVTCRRSFEAPSRPHNLKTCSPVCRLARQSVVHAKAAATYRTVRRDRCVDSNRRYLAKNPGINKQWRSVRERALRSRQRSPVVSVCLGCSGVFVQRWSSSPGRYCSAECGWKLYWTHHRKRRRDIGWLFSIRKKYGPALSAPFVMESLVALRAFRQKLTAA